MSSTVGIVCGRGSFAVHFGDHVWSGDHLRLQIICVTAVLKNCSTFRGSCWFSLDVTKIQTTKLSILLGLYFLDVLEHLKTNIHTKFHLKGVLGFVTSKLEFSIACSF